METPRDVDIEELISDREKFNAFVYTPVEEAVEELQKRNRDKSLKEKIRSLLGDAIPEPLENDIRGVLFRQVATPNYELRRFVSIIDAIGLKPLFWEYHQDKFVAKNEVKYYLGMLAFFLKRGKKGGLVCEYEKIIDFNSSNGKKLSEVKTVWDQDLISFHHSLFNTTYRVFSPEVFFDASDWLKNHGGTALDYYKNYLMLFITHGILFENVMLDSKEISFTREIFLPAFIDVMKRTGSKPIIVALEPTEIETDEFWMCHPHSSKELVNNTLKEVVVIK